MPSDCANGSADSASCRARSTASSSDSFGSGSHALTGIFHDPAIGEERARIQAQDELSAGREGIDCGLRRIVRPGDLTVVKHVGGCANSVRQRR